VKLDRKAYYFGVASIAGMGVLLALTVLTQVGHVHATIAMHTAIGIVAVMVVGCVVIATHLVRSGRVVDVDRDDDLDLEDEIRYD
jgi:hypothetical protein